MRSAVDGINRWLHEPLSWPSRARCFGAWGYAFNRAFDEARERNQKVYVYKGVLDGEHVWITALDPGPRRTREAHS